MSVPRPNPISAIQDRFGLSDVDFAQVLDTSVITLRTAKTGRAVYPRAVYDGLETLGFDPESTDDGVGLARSIRARMREIGGRVEVDSRPGSGAEVRLWGR